MNQDEPNRVGNEAVSVGEEPASNALSAASAREQQAEPQSSGEPRAALEAPASEKSIEGPPTTVDLAFSRESADPELATDGERPRAGDAGSGASEAREGGDDTGRETSAPPCLEAEAIEDRASAPPSESVPTQRVPSVDFQAEHVPSSLESDAPSSPSDGEAAGRDSALPIESRNFLPDDSEGPRDSSSAPTRRTLHPPGLDESPQSSGTPTLAALIERSNLRSKAPQARSIPGNLFAAPAFEPGSGEWSSPFAQQPASGAPVTREEGATLPARTGRTSRASVALLVTAVAGLSFVAGLSVRQSRTAITAVEGAGERTREPTHNIQAAKPTITAPDFAVEPAAPEQRPASIPLTEPPRSLELGANQARPEVPAPATAAAPAPAYQASAARMPRPGPTRVEAATRPPPFVQGPPSPGRNHPAKTQFESAFDARAAEAAIIESAARASACKQRDDPSGVAVVTVTFSPSGRTTTANVSGKPFAGTATGGCIAATLRAARVPAFSGEYVTVRKSVRID